VKPSSSRGLAGVLDALEQAHGKPARPRVIDPFEQVLLENVAYLQTDERREQAFRALEKEVGLGAGEILGAKKAALLEVAALGGMRPMDRVERLLECARTWVELGEELPPELAKAKKALRRFPGIGEPGAEKVLLFARLAPLLALESNGLRVLLRMGYGEESKNYAASLKSAQRAAALELAETVDARIRAFQLLRTHGKEMCKTNGPVCEACPVNDRCAFFARGR
jgi:endonuclease III